jgi:hypothetical protein
VKSADDFLSVEISPLRAFRASVDMTGFDVLLTVFGRECRVGLFAPSSQ